MIVNKVLNITSDDVENQKGFANSFRLETHASK